MNGRGIHPKPVQYDEDSVMVCLYRLPSVFWCHKYRPWETIHSTDFANALTSLFTSLQETPDYSVSEGSPRRLVYFLTKSLHLQDSDTNPNTTASSIAGEAFQLDGRKRRIEAGQLRKSVLGKKHNRLDESKVRWDYLMRKDQGDHLLTRLYFAGR